MGNFLRYGRGRGTGRMRRARVDLDSVGPQAAGRTRSCATAAARPS
jgi:hypothetical protein